MPDRTKVFISYSHEDRLWLNKVEQHIAVLERKGLVDLWSDTRIEAGGEWERDIEYALSNAKIAVLLISPAFMASKFIWAQEVPRIEAHAAQGMEALPLIVRPCAWQLEVFLTRLMARPTDGRPLSLRGESEIDSDLSAFAYEIAKKVGRSPTLINPLRDGSSRNPAIASTEGTRAITGRWSGVYNGSLPIQLEIEQSSSTSFRGKMEYPGDETITIVEGTLQQTWSHDDGIWAQIDRSGAGDPLSAVSFREVQYERKGSRKVSFDGEYRGFLVPSRIFGAWFSGKRLIGPFKLQLTSSA
jgi:hypothetical protein